MRSCATGATPALQTLLRALIQLHVRRPPLRRFSDNSFVLLPWANRSLTFTSSQPALSPADLQASLSAMSVADTVTPAAENNAIPSVNTFDTNVLNFIAGVFEGGVTPTMDPLALSKSAGIVPRVASCGGSPNPCALTNSTQ